MFYFLILFVSFYRRYLSATQTVFSNLHISKNLQLEERSQRGVENLTGTKAVEMVGWRWGFPPPPSHLSPYIPAN